ncbi:uncharacterized protein LOC124913370 [Impatiens glandulifera]|uniref:uncharacterized protein LOC124913370 n=1 Tax=Impatiens glandulifera TaxID=253017 RepID=UPI001FB17332|nr:uncharacterized protein LOC124913370 [Impatiens glandulifera]
MDSRDRIDLSNYDRFSVEYLNGIENFLEYAFREGGDGGKVRCPCKKCVLNKLKVRGEIYDDLVVNGIMSGYSTWFSHGEFLSNQSTSQPIPNVQHDSPNNDMTQLVQEALGILQQTTRMDVDENDEEDVNMFDDYVEANTQDSNPNVQKFDQLLKDANEELWPGCKTFSKLSFILNVYNVKCQHGWSNQSFDTLMKILKDAFPDSNTFPSSYKETKKIVDNLGLKYEKIDACPNNCMLFWKEHKDTKVENCLKCGTSRWKNNEASNLTESSKSSGVKKKKVAAKILRHFPLIPRLQRLFVSSKTSNLMVWHDKERIKDGIMRHPADSKAWKSFDSLYPDFAKDSRNVRLGLAADGFNPFRTMRVNHSTWPVILMPYNLPPWLCMKEAYMMLSLLIPGPSGPGNDIDVYLQPLIEELKQLWEFGVESFDASKKEIFKLHATLMWTINDFPAYGNLSGWSTYGSFACPCCNKDTCSKYLLDSKKFCYMGHRRFLDRSHNYRFDLKSFDGEEELRSSPSMLCGSKVLDQLQNIKFDYGKLNKKVTGVFEKTWKKKSIFFELPYWKHNLLRHNLDVMHIEKNVCDNIVNTLLKVNKKSKDNANARLDLQKMNIRKDLWLKQQGQDRYYVPPACFTMSSDEMNKFLEVLENIKLPDGYASNISRCIRSQRKLYGLKSHDCHVLMQELLPISLRNTLPSKVSSVLIELCNYFKAICAKSLSNSEVKSLQDKAPVILCHLEKIFLPSFFTVMVHLVVHLADEVELAGPVFFRWMYPIERYLGKLKSYVRNQARPEGSIAEAYIADECLTFCARYLDDNKMIGEKSVRNHAHQQSNEQICLFPNVGQHYGAIHVITLDEMTYIQAHRYVLFNCGIIEEFRRDHHTTIKRLHRHRRLSPREIEKKHCESFHEWLKEEVNNSSLSFNGRITPEVKIIARGPHRIVKRFRAYDVKNGYRFRTKDSEVNLSTQNCGVMVISKTNSYASTSDRRPIIGDVVYYGILTDIIELNYSDEFKIVLFRCDWADVDQKTGIKKDLLGFTMINFSRLIHTGKYLTYDPFVFASQCQQVIYVKDVSNPGWFLPRQLKVRNTYDMGDQSMVHIEIEESSLIIGDDDVDWVRDDIEGETINQLA